MYGIILDNRLVATSDDKFTEEVGQQYVSTDDEKYLIVNIPDTSIEEMLLQCLVPIVLLDTIQHTRKENDLPLFEGNSLNYINAILANIAYLNFTATVLNVPGNMETQLIAFVGEYEAWKGAMLQQLTECSPAQLGVAIGDIMEEIGHFLQLINIMRAYSNTEVAETNTPDSLSRAYVAEDESYGIVDFSGALSEVLSNGLPDTGSIN